MNFFKENGFLSAEGEQLISEVKVALTNMLASPEVQKMDKSQIRILNSNLNKIIGEMISDHLITLSESNK
jgi:hypothetical protein